METLLLKTLKTLRKRAESAACQFPNLRCVVIHAGPGAHAFLNQDPVPYKPGMSESGGFSVYRTGDTPDQSTNRRFYFIGPEDGIRLFRKLSADAGRCLTGLPAAILSSIPCESLKAATPDLRWLWCLFDLAWQQRPGTGLHAEKRIEFSGLGLQYAGEALRRQKASFKHPSELFRAYKKELSEYFYSELRDVFMDTVYAIDLLMSDLRPPRASQSTSTDSKSSGKRYTYEQIGKGTTLSKSTLREYRRQAKLDARRGQRNLTFSAEEVHAIAEAHFQRNANALSLWGRFLEQIDGK